MQELLDWTHGRSFRDAALLTLLANVAVFAAALAFGALLARTFEKRRVALIPPPLSRHELVLAALCVLFNSVVMLGGWLLFREGVLVVDGRSLGWRWLLDALVLGLVMDFAMYVTHRLAHVEPFYRWVHGIHHRYEHPRPLTLFVLHPIEVLGFGGLWIAVLCRVTHQRRRDDSRAASRQVRVHGGRRWQQDDGSRMRRRRGGAFARRSERDSVRESGRARTASTVAPFAPGG